MWQQKFLLKWATMVTAVFTERTEKKLVLGDAHPAGVLSVTVEEAINISKLLL